MRFSDIKVGYIYNVIFDPVRDCEFDGRHLAVVLKRNNDKYAVYNQVRTVKADRFIALKEGSAVKECPMEKYIFHKLLFLGLREMVYSIPQDERIEILKSAYEAELISKAKDMAYQIVKLRKEEIPDKKQIDEFLVQINETIKGVTYSLDKQLVKDGIDAIFNEAKNA